MRATPTFIYSSTLDLSLPLSAQVAHCHLTLICTKMKKQLPNLSMHLYNLRCFMDNILGLIDIFKGTRSLEAIRDDLPDQSGDVLC